MKGRNKRCIKYDPPPIGTTALRICECNSCSIPTRKDQQGLREQVTRALIYMQNKDNFIKRSQDAQDSTA